MSVIEPLIRNMENNIAEYNIHSIRMLLQGLGLDQTGLHKSSELPHEGDSNELLCSLTKSVGGSTYMCGGGADGYQDEAVFKNQGIQLQYQTFTHPIYAQQHHKNPFVSGLSVIDALMNLGWGKTAELIRGSVC